MMKVPYFDVKKSHKNIYPQLNRAFKSVIDSGRIVLGPQLLEFEKNYAAFSGTKYCVGVGCGLDAITLSLDSAGVSKGDEVIIPSNAYIAAIISILHVGAVPVLVEPKESTYNLDPSLLEEKISKKTKAVIPVHFFGQICEMGPIMKFAKKYNLNVIEDNAQAHGSTYKGKTAGSFGIANATSFYPTKNLGSLGEAGAVTTDSKSIYEKVRMLRNYGEQARYNNVMVGYNSRMDEIQAAFLNVRLKDVGKMNSRRKKIAAMYLDRLSGLGDVVLPTIEKDVESVFHIFPIRTVHRDKLQNHLLKKGVVALIHYPTPPHLQKGYSFLGYKKGDFPIAEKLSLTSLSLPIFPEMNDSQVEYVCKMIKTYFK